MARGKVKQLAALMSALFFLYGCAAVLLGVGAGMGIGAYKWVEGRLVREYPLSYARAWDATNTALANLRISISNSIDEGTKGNIEAVRRDGAKVSIKLKYRGQGVTSIAVRVGMFGDRLEAEKIHNAIAAAAGIR